MWSPFVIMSTLVNFPHSTHQEVVHFMSELAEMVIKEPPCDIYTFAQEYFEKLLLQRDGGVDREYGMLRQCAMFIKKSPQGEINLGKINRRRQIDFIGLYRKHSEEWRSYQDDDDRLIIEECLPIEGIPKETTNEKEADDVFLEKDNIVEEENEQINEENLQINEETNEEENLQEDEENLAEKVKEMPQTPFRAPLKLYKSIQNVSFDAIAEDEELRTHSANQEILNETTNLEFPESHLDIIPKLTSQDTLIVNHLIQIYLPNPLVASFEEILQEKDLQEVELIPYKSNCGYAVKFSILAWNDYGIVFSVECGSESEVIVFLLKMPDDELDLVGDNPLLKAIEFGKESPKFEVDSEVFRGFLMKFLDSFYPQGEYQQLLFAKAEGLEDFPVNSTEILALEYKESVDVQENTFDDIQIKCPEIKEFSEGPQSEIGKNLGFFRIGNDGDYNGTYQLFRPRSAPAPKVPKHQRQRVKSAK